MKLIFDDVPDLWRGDVTVVLAIIVLLFPVSASVLCIGPDGHMAIEDINATCCASSHINDRSANRPDNGLAAAGDCSNCTDYFLTPNRWGALLESHNNVVPQSLADACLIHHLPGDISFSLCPSIMIKKSDALRSLTASVPLRC
jgi:hypothetical protein